MAKKLELIPIQGKTIMDKYLMAFDYDGILVRLKDREEALNIDYWTRIFQT